LQSSGSLLRDTDVNRPLRTVKLGACLEQFERRKDRPGAWGHCRRIVVVAAQPPSEALAKNGPGWLNKGGFDRSMAELDQAISLDAKYAGAYSLRCSAWLDKGNADI
jgi:hypothetical protein